MRTVARLFLAIVLASLFAFKKVIDSSLTDQDYWRRIRSEEETIDRFYLIHYARTKITNHIFPTNPVILDSNIFTIAQLFPTTDALQNQENETLCEDIDAWARQPRLRNIDPGNHYVGAALTKDAVSIADDLLGQTLCHKDGRFRTTSTEQWNTSDVSLLKEWEFKLIYLAVHDFHHRPARDEYQERTQCPQAIHTNDFQCSDSKLLVSTMPNLGMGAVVRLTAVSHVLSAIATDRVPLFVANTTVGPHFLQDPWNLVSCNRKDPQCIFLPTTPCTLLAADLVNATVLNATESRNVRRQGNMPNYLDHHRVLVMEPAIHPAKGDVFRGIHKAVRRRVYNRAMKLLVEWNNPTNAAEIMDESKFRFLEEAAKRILQSDDAPDELQYSYGHRNYRIAHAILLYLLRPNKSAKTNLNEHMRRILPHPLTPETTIGLPIRGSDKCDKESTCLEFDQYMRLAKETWDGVELSSGARGTLIMTTEDEQVFRKRVLYNETVGFPLDFVVNENDSLQGSGNTRVFGQNADDIMMSSLVAIQMQLNAGRIFGNCCSNFHLMLFDLVQEGCGLTTEATCLQETKDYNICCSWTRNDECNKIRNEYQQSRETPEQRLIREARELFSSTTHRVRVMPSP